MSFCLARLFTAEERIVLTVIELIAAILIAIALVGAIIAADQCAAGKRQGGRGKGKYENRALLHGNLPSINQRERIFDRSD
jgi:hypothetical protein